MIIARSCSFAPSKVSLPEIVNANLSKNFKTRTTAYSITFGQILPEVSGKSKA